MMSIYIDSISIREFRGIKDLELSRLSHINIIAGDNNSGKTSILEAISLLKNPTDLYNLFKVSRMREENMIFSSMPFFDSFLNMLPQDTMHLGIETKGKIGNISLDVYGEVKKILLDKNSFELRHQMRFGNEMNETETIAFSGFLEYKINSIYNRIPIELNPYTRFGDVQKQRTVYANISYLSPAKHLSNNIVSRIVRFDSYKELCVYLLQLFDSNIDDILYLKNDFTHRPIECIHHKKLGIMPLSTYGDGIKKVLALANGIASAKDGILMIDEIETSIHKKYYEDIFYFLFKACRQYNVQLFITTHNQEAIDAILAVQQYNGIVVEDDPVNVITFRNDKKNNRTFSRILSGSEVVLNREKFDFEVRI